MNRNTYTSEYSVPSLSLASSRSKRAIPTKDTNSEMIGGVDAKTKIDIMERINRPPIFSAKNVRQSKISIENSVRSNQFISQSSNNINSLNRNVYLSREQPVESNQVTFREQTKQIEKRKVNFMKSPSGSLLRNPQSNKNIGSLIEKKVEQRIGQANKSLFERRLAKLFEQAESYDKQLMGMYDGNNQVLSKQLRALEEYRKQALSFDFGPYYIKI